MPRSEKNMYGRNTDLSTYHSLQSQKPRGPQTDRPGLGIVKISHNDFAVSPFKCAWQAQVPVYWIIYFVSQVLVHWPPSLCLGWGKCHQKCTGSLFILVVGSDYKEGVNQFRETATTSTHPLYFDMTIVRNIWRSSNYISAALHSFVLSDRSPVIFITSTYSAKYERIRYQLSIVTIVANAVDIIFQTTYLKLAIYHYKRFVRRAGRPFLQVTV